MLGIDLGASAVRGALFDGKNAEAVRVPGGDGGVVSAVTFGTDPPLLGSAALGYQVTAPATTLCGVRSYLGYRDGDASPDPQGPAVMERQGQAYVELRGGARSIPSACALLLDRVGSLAEAQLGRPLERTVVSFPLSFNAAEYQDLERTLKCASLPEPRLICEPIAAAQALSAMGDFRNLIIVDVGASDVYAAHLRIPPEGIPELDLVEAEPFGGDQVDAGIVALMQSKLQLDLAGPSLAMLRQQCQSLKHELSSSKSSHALMPGYVVGAAEDVRLELGSEELENVLAPLLTVVESCCLRLRSAMGTAATQAPLFAIGGMTRLPAVRAAVERTLGVSARSYKNPRMAVAVGCAMIAGRHEEALAALADTPRVTLPPASPLTTSSRPPAFQHLEVSYPKTQALPADLQMLADQASPARPASLEAPAPPGPESGPETSHDPPRRTSIVPADLKGGGILNPATAEGLLALPLSRAPTPEDMNPASLAVLMMVLRHPSRHGRLTLQMEGKEGLRFDISDGLAYLSAMERKALFDAFHLPGGRYRFEVKPIKEDPRREAHMVLNLVVDAMKEVVRQLDPDDMMEALGDRVKLAPHVGPRQARLVSRLPLLPMEQRIVKYTFNGKQSAEEAVEHLGGRRHTCISLMLLLTVYDLITWEQPTAVEKGGLEEAIKMRARRAASENHFEVLEVHWSALSEEVDAAFHRLRSELAKGGQAHSVAPQACAELMQRVSEAYRVLKQADLRNAYRTRAYPQIDVKAMSDFLEKKERAWALRNDGRSEVRRARRKREGIRGTD